MKTFCPRSNLIILMSLLGFTHFLYIYIYIYVDFLKVEKLFRESVTKKLRTCFQYKECKICLPVSVCVCVCVCVCVSSSSYLF